MARIVENSLEDRYNGIAGTVKLYITVKRGGK